MGKPKDMALRYKVYMYLFMHIRRHGQTPRQKDIARTFGCNHQKLPYVIRDIEALGWIKRVPGSREIEILEKAS